MRRLYNIISFGGMASRSLPSNRASPLDSPRRRSSVSATVVLPEPDSPTMPRVFPRATLKDTSLTALNSLFQSSTGERRSGLEEIVDHRQPPRATLKLRPAKQQRPRVGVLRRFEYLL